MAADDVLRIESVRAYRYRIPLKHAYGTARGRTTASTNFVVHLGGRRGDRHFDGYGESQPRHVLTGDGEKNRDSAWDFLRRALNDIDGLTIHARTRGEALQEIRRVMRELGTLARSEAKEIHGTKPFRGTLLGIEVALLDVLSRSLSLRVSELLGEKRSEIGVSISTISTTTSAGEVADRVERQRRFPMTRLKGGSGVDANIDLLHQAHIGNQRNSLVKPLWIDLNEAMTFETAQEFIRKAVDEMVSGNLPAVLTIEGPLAKAEGDRHGDLQRVADDIVAEQSIHRSVVIEIMPDESMWDVDDFHSLEECGGTNAINIKAPKAGGLLASLDLAEAAVTANPDIKICIGGMLGTSELTAWALHNLARAMPRIDYLTAVPPRNVDPIASPRSKYVARGSNIIAPQKDLGLGTKLDLVKLQPYIEDAYSKLPDAVPSTESVARRGSREAVLNLPVKQSPSRRRTALLVSFRVLISGQSLAGAGYVEWLVELADQHGVSGWVRSNGPDSLEALVRGKPTVVTGVLTQMESGPSGVRVENVDICRSDTIPYAGFRVRPGGDHSGARRRNGVLGRIAVKFGRRRNAKPLAQNDSAVGEVKERGRRGYPPVSTHSPETDCHERPERLRTSTGISLAALGHMLGGSWSTAADLSTKVQAGSFLIDRLPKSSLFFIMDGPSWTPRLRRSSHQRERGPRRLLEKAAGEGAVAAVSATTIKDPPIPVLRVEDSREALWDFARKARENYANPVVGITGTVGKSTSTMLLSHVLGQYADVHTSEGNWNTVDGVSNTLAGLVRNPDVAVVEAAISGFVRVSGYSTAQMISPDVAIITAIGSAHLDVAPTVEDTARIKGRLLENISSNGVAILNADTPLTDYLRGTAFRSGAGEVIRFGRARDADYRLVSWSLTDTGTRIRVGVDGQFLEYDMSAVGEAIAFNSVGVLAAARTLGLDTAQILAGFSTYRPKDDVTALHEIQVGEGSALLIDDSTNATVLSMKAAFDLLAQLAKKRGGRPVAVLGQINFLGGKTEEVHASLADPLKAAGVELVMTTGAGMRQLRMALGADVCGTHADTPTELAEAVWSELRPGDVVLVKGSSAGTGFRRVASALRARG